MPEDGVRIRPIQRLKVADAVAAQLSRLITRGNYDGAGRLPAERVLAEQFGVGRSSMREALRSLEAEGLVRIEHGLGVFLVGDEESRDGKQSLLVADNFTVPEYFEVRLPLERDAAGFAARRATAADLDELTSLLGRAADPRLSDDDFIELDDQLHRGIVKATKNSLLLEVMTQLRPLFLTYSHQVISLPGRRATAHAGHVEIVQAVCDRRARDARSAAVGHVRAAEADLVAYLHPQEETETRATESADVDGTGSS